MVKSIYHQGNRGTPPDFRTLYPLQICVPVAETMIKAVVLDHLSASNLMSARIVQSRILLAHLNCSLYIF